MTILNTQPKIRTFRKYFHSIHRHNNKTTTWELHLNFFPVVDHKLRNLLSTTSKPDIFFFGITVIFFLLRQIHTTIATVLLSTPQNTNCYLDRFLFNKSMPRKYTDEIFISRHEGKTQSIKSPSTDIRYCIYLSQLKFHCFSSLNISLKAQYNAVQ